IGIVGLKIYRNIQSIGSGYRNVTAFYALHISATGRKLRVDVFAFRIDVPKVPAVKGYIKPGYTDVVFDAELIAKHYLSEFEKCCIEDTERGWAVVFIAGSILCGYPRIIRPSIGNGIGAVRMENYVRFHAIHDNTILPYAVCCGAVKNPRIHSHFRWEERRVGKESRSR